MNANNPKATNERPRRWTHNGHVYWSLVTGDAEIVASMPDSYTPFFPPMRAKYEVYSRKKGLARFLGYLEGAPLARACRVFQRVFAEGVHASV